MVNPAAVNWFIVGDKAKIIAHLDQLGFDSIIEIDADGNPIAEPLTVKKEELKN